MKNHFYNLLIITCLFAVAGCSESPEQSSADRSNASASTQSSSWILASAPDGAVDVGAAKQTVQEGEQVVIRGRIGGRKEPVSEESSIFVMMDPAIPSCQELHKDQCPTPWDYCCEPKDSLTANLATVQLVDGDGRPLTIDWNASGLKPLDTIIVVGTVGPRPAPEVFTIKATGVHKAERSTPDQ